MSLTDTGENRGLDWLTGNSTTAPTLPLKVALLTAAGSESSAGTEVSGGSYARQNVTFGAATGGATSNTGLVRFSDLPAATVTHMEIWDSAGSPVRWWHGALTSSRTVSAGDAIEFAIGDIDLTLS